MMPKTIVHLMSGGLDSTVLLYDLHGQGHRVHCVLFNYKQRHAQELLWARHHCERLTVQYTTMDLPELRGSEITDGQGGVVVPNRNMVFLALAVNVAVVARADTITVAANKDDEEVFPDCRATFVARLNEAVRAAGYDIEVCGPYLDRTKAWIVAHGQELGVRLDETWSCYRGGLRPCGKCLACVKRREALEALPT